MFFSIFVFLLVLSILVLVHEFGHFWTARKNGILVEEFGFGLPPRMFGKKIGETIYSVNWLPFGGFVRLHGEQTEEGVTNQKRAFLNKSKLARTAVIVAGVVMNAILAVVCFAIVYSFTGIPRDTDDIKVLDIAEGSPVTTAGLLVGDVIKKADGVEFTKTVDFIKYIDTKRGQKVKIETKEGKKLTITPRENPPEGQGPLGVVISTSETYFPPVWQRPFYGIYYGFKDAYFWGKNIFVGLSSMVTGLFQGNVPKDVSGPVGIYAVTTEVAKNGGILALINFIGILSVNLAILNILPFPALDGGRLLFIVIEAVFGRKVLPKVEGVIHTVGMVILLALIVVVSVSDVRRLISAGSISDFLNSMGNK